MDILVIGLGNVLLEDEGIGVRAVEALQQRYQLPESVEVIDGGTSAMDLLRPLEGRERVIIADAVKTGDPAGTLVRIPNDEVPKFFQTKISPHQLGLSDLLALLTVTDRAPRELSIIGMVPAGMATRVGLTDTVADQLDEMVEMLAEEIRSLGIELTPRQGEVGCWEKAAQE